MPDYLPFTDEEFDDFATTFLNIEKIDGSGNVGPQSEVESATILG